MALSISTFLLQSIFLATCLQVLCAVVICYNGQHNLAAKKLRDKLQGLLEELTPFN